MGAFGQIAARARRSLRRALSGGTAEVLILCYHRVCDVEINRWGVTVTPRRFEEHLGALKARYPVLALPDAVTALQDGSLRQRAVVLTFDDGYVDNLWHAKPLLERYSAPATVFVAAGYVGDPREFWWNELDRLIYLSPALPPV
ncbi:MAG TPA: polysaccharide deacetylase family protein, partial [Armatimonadota bacterium]|nr:polysaccharide deacetylase family protein [Armatimonadota bacterium]